MVKTSLENKILYCYRSGRQNYGDNAIGYIQLRQKQSLCELKAKITPEHKIKSKNYNVQCIINTAEKSVLEAKCYDCAASEGGCKHAVAFLMWLHRRSEEPSPTEKTCYWKKSLLSAASTTNKFINTSDFSKTKITTIYDNSLLEEYILESKKRKLENSLMRYHYPFKYSSLSIYHLTLNFKNITVVSKNIMEYFIEFCSDQMDDYLIQEVEKGTREQSASKLWQEMRYARITASKVYEVVKCKTLSGSLVETILGAKIFQTKAMSRGLKLEKDILNILSKDMSTEFLKAGIFLSKEFPLVGASPDAINKDFVVEIKSPSTDKTFSNYLDTDGNIKPRYYYQMQLQMFLSKRKKGIFVVADPKFEMSKKISVKYCDYDNELVTDMLEKVNQFWIKAIYNKII